MKIKVNDVIYHVKKFGKGEPVLLLHGFTGCIENWNEYISEWQDTYQFIMLDIIGHGETEKPLNPQRYKMEYIIEDVHCLLQQLELEEVHIVGYSMGGRLALSLAITYPNLVNTLVLESSSPGLKTIEEAKARKINDEKLAIMIEEKGISSFVDFWENIALFASQQNLPYQKRKNIREQRLKNNTIGLANSLRGMGTGSQPSWWDKLAIFSKPVLLLCGELDKKFCDIARNMDRALPNSKIVEIKQVGHAIHVEDPRIFGKIVDGFIKGNSSTKRNIT